MSHRDAEASVRAARGALFGPIALLLAIAALIVLATLAGTCEDQMELGTGRRARVYYVGPVEVSTIESSTEASVWATSHAPDNYRPRWIVNIVKSPLGQLVCRGAPNIAERIYDTNLPESERLELLHDWQVDVTELPHDGSWVLLQREWLKILGDD